MESRRELRVRLMAFVYVIISVWYMLSLHNKIAEQEDVVGLCMDITQLGAGAELYVIQADGIIAFRE